MTGERGASGRGDEATHPGSSGAILRILGFLLLAFLAAWILATAFGLIGRPPLPRLFGVGTQHASEFTFTPAVQKQIEEAQGLMGATNRRYTVLRWLADLATWASFLVTALITLVTGSFNLRRPDQADAPQGADRGEGKRPMGRFQLLGFLAAVASVCTLLGSQLSSQASAAMVCAKEVRDQITGVAQAIRDNPQSEVVQLTRLRDATERGCP